MTYVRMLLAALATALLPVPPAAAATPAGTGPVAQAQAMVQDARHDMIEQPAMAELRAFRFGNRIRILPASRERDIAVAKAFWVMGEASTRQSNLPRAERLLSRAAALARRTGDLQTIADVASSQASLDEEMGRPGQAVRKYQLAIQAYQRLGSRRSQSIALQNLGSLYVHANDTERGARYIRQAAAVYRDEPLLLATIQNILGTVYASTGRNDVAEREYATGIMHARKAAMPTLEVQMNNNRVRALMALGRVREATALNRGTRALVAAGATATDHYLAIQALLAGARGERDKAQRIADDLSAKLRNEDPATASQDIHHLLYDAYRRIGLAEPALEQLEIATRAQDRTTAETLTAQNAMLGARFDYASQDLRITQMKAEQMRRSMVEGRRTMTWMTITATTILLAMTIGLHLSRRSRKRIAAINAQLKTSNADLQQALDEVVLRERAERQAIQMSEHDVLTGLPNRRHLMTRFLQDVIEEGEDDTNVAVMLLDLDRFKPINDIHGHEVGDLLLIEVAKRLRGQCEGRRAKAVRLGGDEFVIVIALDEGEDGDALAQETIASLNRPFDIDGRRLTIGVSIGVSVHARDGKEVSELLRKADISMYEAKRLGRNRYRFFDEQMDIRLRERAQTEADLHHAVQEEMIEVQYQPIHDFSTGRTGSFEALARWTHPLRGPVSPEEFIPIAEDVGLIARITDIVLRQACRTAREWPADVSVSVNLSPMLLGDEWLAPRIMGILAEEGLPPHRLVIEITENAVISDVRHAAEVIASLRRSGIRVALDDFGKGHSSLSQLHELAFDYLKLDCSFVRTLENPHSMKISAAVCGMAKAMEIPVTAEGIETDEAARTLEAMGFNHGQGYLYGRPMTAPRAREMAWGRSGEDERQVA